jgi:hypothetical protein
MARPPSAALEIFTKPPSPSFRLAFRGQIIGGLPASASTSSTLTPLPTSISGASIHHPMGSTSTTNEIDPSVGVQPPFVLAVPLENDSQAGSSRGGERAITPQTNLQTNLRASRRSLVGNDTSPYAIKIAPKTTGKRKGKAKASDPDGILEAVVSTILSDLVGHMATLKLDFFLLVLAKSRLLFSLRGDRQVFVL